MGAGASETLRSRPSSSRFVLMRQHGSGFISQTESVQGPGNSTFTLRLSMQDYNTVAADISTDEQLQSPVSNVDTAVRKVRSRSLPPMDGASPTSLALQAFDEAHEDHTGSSGSIGVPKTEDNNSGKSPRPTPKLSSSQVSSGTEPQVEDDVEADMITYSDEPFEEDTIEWKRGETLGSGSYGTVFLARDEHTGSLMAVKEILVEEEKDSDIEKTSREVHVLKTLQHENVVKYLGSQLDKDSKRLYIFTEWVPGGNLEQNRKRFGPNERVIRRFTRQIVQGVAYLHAQNVIHHDIKPSNLLVDQFGVVKLADFGSSRLISANGSTIVNNESMRGTPNYMAPEVIRQTGRGRKSDIWSIGCSVLRLLTGRAPWGDKKFDSQIALLYYIAHLDKMPPLSESDAALMSEDAQSFVMACLQIDPHKRPTAQELLQHPFINTSFISPSVSPVRSTIRANSTPLTGISPLRISLDTPGTTDIDVKTTPPSSKRRSMSVAVSPSEFSTTSPTRADSPKTKPSHAVESKSQAKRQHIPSRSFFDISGEEDFSSRSIHTTIHVNSRTNSHARIQPLPHPNDLPPLQVGSKTSSMKVTKPSIVDDFDSVEEIGTYIEDNHTTLVRDHRASTASNVTSTLRWEEQPIVITDAARLEQERQQARAAEEQIKRIERERQFQAELLEFRRQQSSQASQRPH